MLRTKSWTLGLLLMTFTGPVAHAVDVLDYVEGEREASVAADTPWDLKELGYLEEKSIRRCKIIWQNGSSSLNRALRIFPPSWRDTAAVDQP